MVRQRGLVVVSMGLAAALLVLLAAAVSTVLSPRAFDASVTGEADPFPDGVHHNPNDAHTKITTSRSSSLQKDYLEREEKKEQLSKAAATSRARADRRQQGRQPPPKQRATATAPSGSSRIPQKVHQMWLSDAPLRGPKKRFQESVERAAGAQGLTYRMWTAADITEQNFPRTWPHMQALVRLHRHDLDYGATLKGQELVSSLRSRMRAALVDMARMEVLYSEGGLWFDIDVEIVNGNNTSLRDLWRLRGADGRFPGLITCALFDGAWEGWNERRRINADDPARADCSSLATGFIGAVERHELFRRILTDRLPRALEEGLAHLPARTAVVTGPRLFGGSIADGDDVHILPAETFYPYVITSWAHRCAHAYAAPEQAAGPLCCACEGPKTQLSPPPERERCHRRQITEESCEAAARRTGRYGGSIAVNHFECGGSWSRSRAQDGRVAGGAKGARKDRSGEVGVE